MYFSCDITTVTTIINCPVEHLLRAIVPLQVLTSTYSILYVRPFAGVHDGGSKATGVGVGVGGGVGSRGEDGLDK